MKKDSAVVAACACALAVALMPGNAALAHRVDEYLQATMFALEADEVRALLRLVPGIAVAPAIIAQMDRNGDGMLSEAEERAYVEHVLGQLTVTVDGQRVQPRLGSWHFPSSADMRDGLGEIQIEYIVAIPRGVATHTLIVDNPHPAARSVYLMNAVVPANPALRILAQRRSA